MTEAIAFTETEAAICIGSRVIEEDKIYWTGGGGAPRYALLLAEKLYTPNICYTLEDGGIGPHSIVPIEPFMILGSAESNYRAISWQSMNSICSQASIGVVDYGLLLAVELDPYGNINSSFVGGDYYHPARRFGGAGGANEVASLAWRTIVFTEQDRRKFVKKVDFITSPGYLDGSPGAREKAGLPQGTGPYRVITPDAIFGYDEETHYMKLLAIAKWVTVDEVIQKMGFEPMIADKVESLEPPREEELTVLRSQIDPEGRVIGEGKWITL